MRPTHLAILALLIALPRPAAAVPRVIPGFQTPESVLVAGDHRYVSNIGAGLDPTGKDGDGFISELDADGRPIDAHAFPPPGSRLDAPKGMALAGGRLFVADIDRVVGFDLDSRAQVFEARLPVGGPVLVNDLAAVDDRRLLLSETIGGTVWALDLASGDFRRLADSVPGANGILYDGATRSALVVGLGADFKGGDVFRVSLDGGATRVARSPHGVFDGIARLPDGGVLVSDWVSIEPPTPGRFLRLGPDGSGPGEAYDAGVPVSGPADFAVDPAGELWIPATLENAVVVAESAR